jgi:hypothetical protein
MATKAKKHSAKAPEWEPLADELEWDDVGGRLLANIARGMYSAQSVLREYVQNAADGYKDLAIPSEEHKIIITPTKTSLAIQDFGVGMDDKGIREAKKIAVSTKSEFDDRVGFRGIGIWAGLPACKRLIVDSTKAGHPYRYRLVFDFEEIMKHLDDNINIKDLVDPRYQIERHGADKDEHYTRVSLEGITDGYKQLLDVTELKRIASQVLPAAVDPGFQHHAALTKLLESWPSYSECHIIIHTPSGPEEAFRCFPEGDLEPPEEKVLVSEGGVELARGWFCRTKKTALRNITPPAVRGFQLRVKNFAVGDVNIFSSEQGYSYNIPKHQELKATSHLTWFCGEIHVTNNDIKPNTPRDDLEREQAARLFIEQLRGFYKDRIVEARAYSEFNPFRNALEEAEEIIAKSAGQGKAKKPVTGEELRALLSKLSEAPNKAKGESEDQSKTLFKQLLRQQWFKDRCSKAITGLKKLLPPSTTAAGGQAKPGTGGTTASQDAGQGGGGSGNQTNKPKKEDTKASSGNGQANSSKVGLTLEAEALVSEIFEVLERNLGDDYEDLPQIEQEIQQVVDTWVSSNAQKSVP